MRANTIVRAIGRNSNPSIRVSVSKGRKAPIIMRIEKKTGRSTSKAAARTILTRLYGEPPRDASPSRRAMLSAMITAPSTIIPKSIAPTDNRPMGMLTKCIRMRENSREKGMVSATNAALGDEVGKLYVKRYFPPASKAAAAN